MGPQMWMSSLVLTIHNFGVPNFDPYPYVPSSVQQHIYIVMSGWESNKKKPKLVMLSPRKFPLWSHHNSTYPNMPPSLGWTTHEKTVGLVKSLWTHPSKMRTFFNGWSHKIPRTWWMFPRFWYLLYPDSHHETRHLMLGGSASHGFLWWFYAW